MNNKQPKRSKHFLFIEPFYSGSHKAFANGLVETSDHRIDLLTLPGVNWDWRLRGSAFHFSNEIKSIERYDGIIVTNVMRLADFRAFYGKKLPPVMVYFHENQLSYPLAPKEKRNPYRCMGDISTALSAERICFNSHFHRHSFINAVNAEMKKVPDYAPDWVKAAIEKKSHVIYPGCFFDDVLSKTTEEVHEPPLIIWNHRWSYDKNAEAFFHALTIIKEKGTPFRLALLGEHSTQIPEAFQQANTLFKDELVCFGFQPDRQAYTDWLKKGDIIISTAMQENYGISVIEAIRYGCVPLLPDRLSYPEILPDSFHDRYIYNSQRQLIKMLDELLTNPHLLLTSTDKLAKTMDKYAWETLKHDYDTALAQLCEGKS